MKDGQVLAARSLHMTRYQHPDLAHRGQREFGIRIVQGAGSGLDGKPHLPDGAAFCRDVKRLSGAWSLDQLAVLDLFPLTSLVECVALLTKRP